MSGAERDPLSGLPIGPRVDAGRRPVPARTVLTGTHVRLEPVDAERHGASLWEETHGPGQDARWQYLFEAPFADRAAFLAYLAAKAQPSDPLCFAIVRITDGRAVGMASLMRTAPEHACTEVGGIVYGASLERTIGATEAQYLLMRYVFDELGYRRYEWKCNALNAPSRAAALRLGFRYEGIFRQHMIIRGRSRDTAWYAVIDQDWPRLREAFQAWLAPGNFDDQGRQRRALSSLREGEGPASGPA